jgi:hypothetical protein
MKLGGAGQQASHSHQFQGSLTSDGITVDDDPAGVLADLCVLLKDDRLLSVSTCHNQGTPKTVAYLDVHPTQQRPEGQPTGAGADDENFRLLHPCFGRLQLLKRRLDVDW